MRRRLAPLLVAPSLAGGVAAVPAVQAAPASLTLAAKSCSGSYVHARILGHEKCLRRGEYCTHTRSANRDYHRYGFNCGTRDRRGSYHLQYR